MKTQCNSDIIAAVATAPGRGGIGVVRISGSDLRHLIVPLCQRELKPRMASYGPFLGGEGEILDQGIALYFPAPHSYTGEDVLELQGHGGPVILQLVLQRCLQLGARLAEPGEFTKRAYLNDKLDLAQAESVADLIEASTVAAARSAVRSLSGDFSQRIHALNDGLIELRMLVEATLDFPEEEIDFIRETDAEQRLARIQEQLETVLAKARQGSLLRAGMQVVLAGQPNVGKSSLLNCFAGEDRAIVTDIAGTTRDTLRESIEIEGVPLHIIDTAGLRDTDCEVERLGIGRTWKEIAKADVVIHLLDARQGLTAEDLNIVSRLPQNVVRVTVLNKADLAGLSANRMESPDGPHITLCAKSGQGVDLLRQELLTIAGWQAGNEDVFAARERHLEALRGAAGHLQQAGGLLLQPELFAEELRLAQERLCSITGEFSADDLLGEIFSRFCIGK